VLGLGGYALDQTPTKDSPDLCDLPHSSPRLSCSGVDPSGGAQVLVEESDFEAAVQVLADRAYEV
jgi:hypothetical protein